MILTILSWFGWHVEAVLWITVTIMFVALWVFAARRKGNGG
jgi:hypothetical protein